ncbi:MAG TPA: cytochrome B [Legionella sp.]|nr:cytochrome B [Legionella sp.]
MAHKGLRFTATCAVILAFLVVMLGAFTRLTDAGLGCPDWPGCYGRLVLPSGLIDLTQAQNQYPEIPIESGKAWTEMAHRYAAGTLGLLILGMALYVFRLVGQRRRVPWVLPSVLLLLVLFQAALGMWTVTLKLLPVVVMGHLLGGILIFACLCYFWWQLSPFQGMCMPRWRAWINVGILIVFCQIALGGWVSSNYAGIACIGFPRCNGQWLPTLYFAKAFDVFSSIGANYQGGVLDNEIRVTIQWIHRIGAYITAVYVLMLSGFLLWCAKSCALRCVAGLALLLVMLQLTFGIINVIYLLPLWAAVAHNGLAALLLASMVSLRYLTSEGVSYDG